MSAIAPVTANVPAPVTCPSEWMRIFAVRLARRRPDISAEQAVLAAIDEYRVCGHLPPETAVEQG